MTDAVTVTAADEAPRKTKSKRGRRVLGLILVLLLLLLGLATYLFIRLVATPPAQNQDVDTGGLTWVRSIYGMNNTVDGQFSLPQGVASGNDGSIFVTDSRKQALMHFTADGRYLESFKGPDDSALFTTGRVAVGPDGLFYICDPSIDVVRVLNAQGEEAGSFGIPQPVSVAVSEDRIVVGSVSGFAILDKQGKPLHIIGSRGKGDDQFDYVHGVAIGEDGTIFVADSFNNRVSAYTPEGERLWINRTGNPGNKAEVGANEQLMVEEAEDVKAGTGLELQLPMGMTIDGAGRLVVIDMFECALAVIDPKDGQVVAKYGAPGGDDGQFFYPVSVDYDSQRDWFTVADNINNRVQVVRLPGSSSGDDTTSAFNRALSGPLRACLFPLVLLIIAFIAWLIYRSVRKRRDKRVAEAAAAAPPLAE